MSDTDYNRLLCNSITSNYRKCENSVKHKIDKETKKIAELLDLSKKMECYARRPAFVAIKDRKPNFRNNTKCRLINPAKNELGLELSRMLQTLSKSTNGEALPLSWTGLSHSHKTTSHVL